MTTALVPGSFDPPTYGHIDVVSRCITIFDRVVVGVVANPSKKPLFTIEERKEMLVECCPWDGVEIAGFDGLLVDFAREVGADVVVKGLRAMTDFDYELQLAQMNRHLSGLDTMFVATKPEYGYLSSSLVREVVALGGTVEELVPSVVAKALEAKFRRV
ncbi:MAG TPA: pantetheine-phosphate adenylyltransferase [Acidimicrobiia bacterium]